MFLDVHSSDDEVLSVIRSAIEEVLSDRGGALTALAESTRLDSLGIDSVTALEIAACIEDRAGVVLSEDVLRTSRRVSDLVKGVRIALDDATSNAGYSGKAASNGV
jgi:acyl carrier protein